LFQELLLFLMAQSSVDGKSSSKSKDVRRQRPPAADYDLDADGFHTPVPAKQRRMSPSQPPPGASPPRQTPQHSRHQQSQPSQGDPEGRQQMDTSDPFTNALYAAGMIPNPQQAPGSSTGRKQFASPADLINSSCLETEDEDAKFYRKPPGNWFPIGFEKFVVVEPFPLDNPKDVYVKIAKYHHKDDGGWQWINSGINLNSSEFTTMMKKMDRIKVLFHGMVDKLAEKSAEKH
jgi:hypothetical protein